MSKKKFDVLWLYISIISYFLMSVTFLLMPLDDILPELKERKTIVIVGIAFWAFLIIGIASQIVLAKRMNSWYRTRRINERRSSVRRIGLVVFGSNKIAAVADIIMIVSFIGLVAAMILLKATGYICYVVLAIFCFAFCMHCILNGKVYYHITHHYECNTYKERFAPNEHKNQKESNYYDKY